MTAFKKIFTAPSFDDESKTQQAYLLNIILWTLICVPVPFVIYAFLLRPDNLSRTLLQATFGETVNIILLVMLHRGYIKAASIIQVSAFWFFFTVTALTGNGVQSEAYLLGYGLVIAIAGILLGGVGASTFTFLSIAAGSWMVYSQIEANTNFGFDNSPLTTWTVSLVLFPVGAVLQHLTSRNTQNALERARASEEKYRLISRVSTDYVFASDVNKDGETKLVWVTGAFESMTGYTYEEYVASGEWPAHVHPEDAAKDAQDMETLKNNRDLRSEIRTFSKTGQIRWERIFAHPVWSEKENRLTGIIGAVQDVTEQKQIEAALTHERDLLQIFMDNIPDTIYFKDTESRFVRVNQAQARFLNINNPQEAIGKTDLDFQNSDLSHKFIDEEKQIIETGQSVLNRIEFNPTTDGKPRWLSATKIPVRDSSGRITGILGVSRDITEQKKIEATLAYERDILQIFMDNIPDFIYFKDTESHFLRINQAHAQFLGVDKPQDALGKTDLDFQNPEIAHELLMQEKQIIETGQPVWNHIEINPTQDGTPRWLSTTKVAAKNELGQTIGIIGISRDVTEQKKAEKLEQSRRTMLEKIIKLGQHVTEVHDLRTTLIRIWNGIHDDLEFERIGLFLYNPERKSMDGTFGTNNQGEMIDEWHTWFLLEGDSQDTKPFLQALEQPNTVFFTNSYQEDYRVPKGHTMSGVKDHALIGAWSGEKPTAIISVDHRITGRPITKEQLEALRLFAGYAGLAIENARLNAALEDELSQRGETLQKQSSILNGIPDMAWLKDKNSRYIAVNEQFANKAGLKIEEIIGKTDFDIWNKSLAEKYQNNDSEIMRNGQRKNAEELETDSSGREYWVETTKTPILNASGEVIGTTGIAREITERKKAQEAEQQRRIILEKVVQLGKRVTASDDLRSTVKKIWHGVHDDLEFDRLAIFLFNPDHDSMDDTFGTNNTGEMVDHWHLSFPIGSTFAALLRNPNGLYFTVNYDVENEIPEDHEMYGVKDYAAVAAWAGDKPVAVICTDHGITHRPITAAQLEALRLFAGYAGLAIENARLNEKIKNELSVQTQAKEREEHRREILERVIKLGQDVTEATDLRTTLTKIWQGVHHGLGFDRLAIFLYNPAQKSMDGTFGTNNSGEMTDDWHISHSVGNKNNPTSQPFFRVLEKPDTIYLTRNFEGDYNIPSGDIMYGVKDFASIAAWAGDKPVAFISVDHNITHRPIADEQLEALRLFAGYAGLAIENTRLNEKIQEELSLQIQAKEREEHRREILEKVVILGQRVTEVYDIRTTLMRIWHGVHDDLGFDRLGIYLYNPEHNSMDGTFGTNIHGEMIDEWHTSISMKEENPESKSFLRVIEKPNTIYITHTYTHDYMTPKEGHIMSGVKDFAAIAAWAGDKPVAVLCVDHVITGRPITEEQLEALRLFAGYAGLALENARLNSALEGELSQRKNFIVELEAKNAELERFTYTVSHDLKSPLVTIKGFLGYLEKDAQAGNYEKLKQDKLRIESAVEKMQNLLKDLLELSRIGRLMNSPIEIPFNEIIKDTLEIVHGQIEAGKVLVEVKSSNIIIKCDRIRLTEVMQNLMDNAIKFMGTQPAPRIEIGNFLDKNENVFYVKDNGIGIAPEFHGKIFGLFDKLATDSDGTGIGLALVKRIIEVHGGRIWVESQVGQGTTFYFTLP